MLMILPYLQLYPALICRQDATSNGTFAPYVACNRDEACNFGAIKDFMIDWGHSMANWTTELELVCASPIAIGLMGTFGYIFISIGSILFGGLLDRYGRKSCLVGSAAVTPIV